MILQRLFAVELMLKRRRHIQNAISRMADFLLRTSEDRNFFTLRRDIFTLTCENTTVPAVNLNRKQRKSSALSIQYSLPYPSAPTAVQKYTWPPQEECALRGPGHPSQTLPEVQVKNTIKIVQRLSERV